MPDPDPNPIEKPPAPSRGALHGLDPGGLFGCALEDGSLPSGKKWEPPKVETIARLLPQFAIEECIGRGGMGAVYRGRQAGLNRPVAIKVLPLEMAADPAFEVRFFREMEALAKLDHPHIVKIFESGRTSEGHLFFVMELVEGNLQTLLENGPLPPELALALTSQICHALQYAHAQKLVHRDIKPANILITKSNEAKLADFGLARLMSEPSDDAAGIATALGSHDPGSGFTGSQMTFGTPPFASPEQEAGRVDHRSDIFALGVTLHMMLTGQAPPKKDTAPLPKATPFDEQLGRIVQKAVERQLDLRYQKIEEMRVAVDRILSTQSAPPTAPRSWKTLLFPAALLLAIALLLLRQFRPVAQISAPASSSVTSANRPPPSSVVTSLTTSAESGFTPLLDTAHLGDWNQAGPGGLRLSDGIATTWAPTGDRQSSGYHWYAARTYRDFILKVEFQMESSASRSAILIRFANPGPNSRSILDEGCEIAIYGTGTERGMTGTLFASQPPRIAAAKADDWNECEIKAVANRFEVTINGILVNELTNQSYGANYSEGYIGIKNHSDGPVQFRNLRIKDLSPPPTAQTNQPPSPLEEPADVADFRKRLLNSKWTHADTVYSDKAVAFAEDGTFHPQWRWRYWITGRRTIHVQFWDSIYKPGNGNVFTFNEDLTQYTCPKPDGTRRIVGTRVGVVEH